MLVTTSITQIRRQIQSQVQIQMQMKSQLLKLLATTSITQIQRQRQRHVQTQRHVRIQAQIKSQLSKRARYQQYNCGRSPGVRLFASIPSLSNCNIVANTSQYL